MGSLMGILGLSQGSRPTTTIVLKLFLTYSLLLVPFMAFQLISGETMELKIYLWLLGWKKTSVQDLIFGGGKKT
jgi:hypothetical protein